MRQSQDCRDDLVKVLTLYLPNTLSPAWICVLKTATPKNKPSFWERNRLVIFIISTLVKPRKENVHPYYAEKIINRPRKSCQTYCMILRDFRGRNILCRHYFVCCYAKIGKLLNVFAHFSNNVTSFALKLAGCV